MPSASDTDRILDSIAELRRDLHSVVQSLGKVQGSHEDLKAYVNGRGEQRISELETRMRVAETSGAVHTTKIAVLVAIATVVMTFALQFISKMMGAR